MSLHPDDPGRTGGLTHVRSDGTAHMVDVSAKAVTAREASAAGRVLLSAAAVSALREGVVPKGDALGVARLAGIPVVFDVIYEPWPTPLARSVGPDRTLVSGLDLLVHQAALQVGLMTGLREIPVEAMRAAGERALAERGVGRHEQPDVVDHERAHPSTLRTAS